MPRAAPPPSVNPLTLRKAWPNRLVLSSGALPVLTLTWRRDHTEVAITYHQVPDDRLCEAIVKIPEESLGLHLERLVACRWKDRLLADEGLYAPLLSVRSPAAVRQVYYGLDALALHLPADQAPEALGYLLALDWDRTTAYFLDSLEDRPGFDDLTGLPPALVLPLAVCRQQLPPADRDGFANLVMSFVGFFGQSGQVETDFLHDLTDLLTRPDASVPMAPLAYRLLTLARTEQFGGLLRMISLGEYLARIGRPLDLSAAAAWDDVTAEVRRTGTALASSLAETDDLPALADPRVLDVFLQVLPDILRYLGTDRWSAGQKAQLRECLRAYLQTGSLGRLKYSEPWKASLEAMLTVQLGSAGRALAFVRRWTEPERIHTFDYSADPRLRQEELDRLEELHSRVDLASLDLPIPDRYRFLVERPFTATYRETLDRWRAEGVAVPEPETFVLLDAEAWARTQVRKESAEVRWDPAKPDSVFVRGLGGLFQEAWSALRGAAPGDEDLLALEDQREKLTATILGRLPARDLPDLVESVLEDCGLDRRQTPFDVQERLRRRLREAVLQYRRQHRDFYDHIMQYKLFRYFGDRPSRREALEAVVKSVGGPEFRAARADLLASVDRELGSDRVLASLIGEPEVAYLRELLSEYEFRRALAVFEKLVNRTVRGEKPWVGGLIVAYAKLLTRIRAGSLKDSGADARERLAGFVDLLGRDWNRFDQLLRHEGTTRALDDLFAGRTLTRANRDYLTEEARAYLNAESRRVYAKIEVWDSDRFLDWMTCTRTVYEPHVAHQQSCMHPDKIHARTGKTEYLMGYVRSPWVKQLYLGSRDLFDPFDEHNKVRCIVFLTPVFLEGREVLALNVQHPYPLNPTRAAWRVLMEGCRRLADEFGLPLLFPDVSAEELQHAAIQTRAKLFAQVTSRRLTVLVPRQEGELQQRDDYESGNLPAARETAFLGQTLTASMVDSRYWFIEGIRMP